MVTPGRRSPGAAPWSRGSADANLFDRDDGSRRRTVAVAEVLLEPTSGAKAQFDGIDDRVGAAPRSILTPSDSRCEIAFSTVCRFTLKRAASDSLEGKRSPVVSAPLAISSARASPTCHHRLMPPFNPVWIILLLPRLPECQTEVGLQRRSNDNSGPGMTGGECGACRAPGLFLSPSPPA